MGVTNSGQQQPPAPMTPQQQQLRGLQTMAVTPYQGGARGGGAAQGVAQLASALMARNKQQALLKGNPGGATQPLPVAQTPVTSSAPPMQGPGGPIGGAQAAPGVPAPMPQAQAAPMPMQQSPLMQTTPGLTPGMMGPP